MAGLRKNAQPYPKLVLNFLIAGRIAPQLFEADRTETLMIHRRWPHRQPLVLDMARAAGSDIGVKCSGLALQQFRVIGMACNAFRR
jgi:hypothetical protein